MKIGILTFHDGINHGAFLQAYCLQQKIKELSDGEVKVINYKAKHHYYNELKAHLFFPPLHKPAFVKIRYRNFLKIQKFKKYHKKFNLTGFAYHLEEIAAKEKFDVVFLGSDEIWNYRNPLVGIDLAYFGKGLGEKTKLVSYAPSFGSVNETESIPEEVVDSLKSIDKISVRDTNSLKLTKKLGLEAVKVLDPTFLYEINTGNIEVPEKNYILVYLNYLDSEWIQSIRHFAGKTGKRLVAVGYPKDWCDKSYVDVDPFEWITFFRNADFVITNTFHGSIYSILNNRQFVVPDPGQKVNKIKSLLEDLGLTDKLLNSPVKLGDVLQEKIDYTVVNAKIEELKNLSLNYIKQQL